LQYAQAATGHQAGSESALRALTFALSQCLFPLLAFLLLRMALQGPARGAAFWQAVTAPLRPRGDAQWLLAMLPIVITMAATVMLGARTASVWGLALAAGLALLATSRARDAGAEVNVKRLWQTLGVLWLVAALASPLWWASRALAREAGVAEPREELALALSEVWSSEFGGEIPWVSGTRALAASVAFYAPEHPRYWSLWNMSVETPWTQGSNIIGDGGVIVCERNDEPCQALADTWSADRRLLSVAKNARGFQFDPKQYIVYWVPPMTAAFSLAR
jgi:hypothetical protein